MAAPAPPFPLLASGRDTCHYKFATPSLPLLLMRAGWRGVLSAWGWQALGNSSLHCLGQSAYLSVLRIPQPSVTKEHQVRFSFPEYLIMNTPELPDPIFDNGEDLTPEIELPTQPDPVYNPLFENLVPEDRKSVV